MFDQEDHCERLSNASLFQRGHGLVTSMLAIVTNKVLAAYYFSKKDVMAISTFKKLNEAFTTLHSTKSPSLSLAKKEKAKNWDWQLQANNWDETCLQADRCGP